MKVILTHNGVITVRRGKSINNSDNNSSGGVRDNNIYNSSREKPVLALLLDLYSKLEVILVSASKFSSCFILYCLLTTFSY